jgi:TolB-like protein/DNA-binding winged helix-turn-helix (wHTH) protein/lipoprotein NlpI
MNSNASHFYSFGPFRLDAVKRRLFRDSEFVPLTPKAFDTLLTLIESAGRIVEKNALMEKLWPGVFVEENNLTQNISALRKALGEKREEPHFILTVPGVGYRFIAEVTQSESGEKPAVVTANVSSTAPETAATEIVASSPAAQAQPRGIGKALLLAGVMIVIGLAGIYYLIARHAKAVRAGTVEPHIKSIAILPFRSLVSEEGDEYLGVGMADALITKLSSLRQIVVRPTNSILRYADSQKDLVEAGHELGVDLVLDGRVQKSGDRIRVTVQLVRASDGAPLWADKFDEKDTDVFTLEDRLTEEVAASLLPTLTGAQKEQLTRRYTEDTEAYQDYIKGRYYWNKRTATGVTKAVGYFEDAILKDPKYALAYAGLSDAYGTLRLVEDVKPEDVMPKARSAALKAIELDPDLAEAHASLGYVKHRYEFDWLGAEKEFKRAIELNPDYSTAHQWYGWYLTCLGKNDAAFEEFKRAQQLDPLSLYVNLTMGIPYYYSQQYDKAAKQFKKVIELDPQLPLAHRWLAKSYQQQGKYDEALAEFQKVVALSGSEEQAPAVGCIYAVTGKQRAAREMLDAMQKLGERHYVSLFHMAAIYAALGEKDRALDLLEKDFKNRNADLITVNIEPEFAGLRSEPRFQQLLKDMGFPQN